MKTGNDEILIPNTQEFIQALQCLSRHINCWHHTAKNFRSNSTADESYGEDQNERIAAYAALNGQISWPPEKAASAATQESPATLP
jgi:hypothetical protein